ncbi:MAG: hypothetical protein C4547_09930 [Phycisphaerales bacterium]|nr:MAG: hypothetical protein C4547_09930 [Phycisphaerales bacterium]
MSTASTRKKPEADFVVRLVGAGLRPWVVPFRSLASVLRAVQRLVDQREDGQAEEDHADQEQSGDTALHLLSIKASSGSYAVAAPDRGAAFDVLRAVGASLKCPDQADWTEATLSSLEELSGVARSLDCSIEFREEATDGSVLARIEPTTYDDVAGLACIDGRTSVYATIERLGGATEMHSSPRSPCVNT